MPYDLSVEAHALLKKFMCTLQSFLVKPIVISINIVTLRNLSFHNTWDAAPSASEQHNLAVPLVQSLCPPVLLR